MKSCCVIRGVIRELLHKPCDKMLIFYVNGSSHQAF